MTNDLHIVIRKGARTLTLCCPGRELEQRYAIALGGNWAADKAVEGDHATPVGEFYICAKNPKSRYFLSLCISYPNAQDAARGLAAGLIDPEEYARIVEAIRLGRMPPQHTKLGGEIYIHGTAERHPAGTKDWTRGCIAMDNAAMGEVYAQVRIGTRVIILR
jgi:murein L,D-transpeptidase YafK